MNEKIEPVAILFDMDGVLIDSLDSWWKSLNNIIVDEGKEEISKQRFIEKFWGDTLQDNLEKLNIDVDNYTFCNNFYDQYIQKVVLFPDTKNVLKSLNKYSLGLITNTPKDCTNKIVKQFGIKKYFKVIITSDQIEKGKPAPDMIFSACKKINCHPEECVIVGDTENDMLAGKKAGSITVGINTKGNFEITNIKDLTTIIEV